MNNTEFYFYTDHRKLLEIIIKGFLSPDKHMKNIRASSSKSDTEVDREVMIFSESFLDLSYNFLDDKTLRPIAIAIKEEKLIQLGLSSKELANGDKIYYGNVMIPHECFSKIILKDKDDLKHLKIRYNDYVSLIDKDNFIFDEKKFKNSQKLINKLNFTSIDKTYSEKDKINISSRIGAFANFMVSQINNEETLNIIAVDYIHTFITSNSENINLYDVLNNISENIPGSSINEEDIMVLIVILVILKYKNFRSRIEKIEKLAKSFSCNYSSDDLHITLILIKTLEEHFDYIRKRITKIDRSKILEGIVNRFKENTESESVNVKKIYKIFDLIKRVFDYQAKWKGVQNAIKKLDYTLTSKFIKAFGVYIREPFDYGKLSDAINMLDEFYDSICKSIAFYYLGLARGIIAFEPVKKSELDEVVPSKIFYKMVFTKDEFYKYNFNHINDIEFDKKNLNEKIKIGDFCIFYKIIKESLTTLKKTNYSFVTQNGVSIEHEFKDYYSDVYEFLQSLIDNRNIITDEILKFFTHKFFNAEYKFLIRSKELKTGKKIKIKIGKNVNIHIDGEISLDLTISKSKFLIYLQSELEKKYKEDYFKMIGIEEKEEIRNEIINSSKKTQKYKPNIENKKKNRKKYSKRKNTKKQENKQQDPDLFDNE